MYAKILKYGLSGAKPGVTRPAAMDVPTSGAAPMSASKPQRPDYATQGGLPQSPVNTLGSPKPRINNRSLSGLMTRTRNNTLGGSNRSNNTSQSSTQGSGNNATHPTKATE